MTPADYKTERQKRGTLKGVAALLGVHWTTVARRESGAIEFSNEAVLALQSLPLRSPKEPRKQRPNTDSQTKVSYETLVTRRQ
jgi:hypothetical protein